MRIKETRREDHNKTYGSIEELFQTIGVEELFQTIGVEVLYEFLY